MASARALLELGIQDSAWILLGAPNPANAPRLPGSQVHPPLPKAMLQAFAEGKLATPPTLRLVDEMLPEPERVTLLVLALPQLTPEQLRRWRAVLCRLGVDSLDAVDKLLRHPQAERARAGFAGPGNDAERSTESQVQWLLRRTDVHCRSGPSGLHLPLRDPDPEVEAKLQNVVVSFVTPRPAPTLESYPGWLN